MKIYGRNLSEIFKLLPWQYKIVVTVSCIFILFIIYYISALLLSLDLRKAETEAVLTMRNLPPEIESVLDPSLAAETNANPRVWMAYTAKIGNSRHIRLSLTSNKCDLWFYNGGGIEGKPDDILAPDGQTVFRSGSWRAETPSLVYDPDDKGREWKLYAYKYFWANDNLRNSIAIAKHYSVIVYKYSSDPAQGWSDERWLFSPGPDYPPAPYEQMVSLHLNTLSPELSDIKSYSRPSAVYKGGYLLMALSAFTGGDTPDRIVLIASKDHGNSWVYLGSPLSARDASLVGSYTKLAGANLLQQDGMVFLSAVFGDEFQRGRGTFVFAFENLGRGILSRDQSTNTPLLVSHRDLREGINHGTIGGGFASYSDACSNKGMFVAEQEGNALKFNIFTTTKKPLVEEK